MRARTFWKTVVADHVDMLPRIVALLTDQGIRFCLIGEQGVNAYVEPVVSLDLDIVIAVEQLPEVKKWLRREFSVEEFSHSLNVSSPGSDLRIQIQTDPRYASFIDRAQVHQVLGYDFPVAAPHDILQGKIWAVQDPHRRTSKRQKDLADIARLLEAFPDLRAQIPKDVQSLLME